MSNSNLNIEDFREWQKQFNEESSKAIDKIDAFFKLKNGMIDLILKAYLAYQENPKEDIDVFYKKLDDHFSEVKDKLLQS